MFCEGLPAVSSDGESARELSRTSFIWALIPFMSVPPSWPNYLQKAPPLHTITLGGRISTCEFGYDTDIDFLVPPQMRGGSLPTCCLSVDLSPVCILCSFARGKKENMSLDATMILSSGLQTQEPTPHWNSYFISRIKCNVFKWKADYNSLSMRISN